MLDSNDKLLFELDAVRRNTGTQVAYWGRNGIHFHSEYLGVVALVMAGLAFGGGVANRNRRHAWFWLGALVVALFPVLWVISAAFTHDPSISSGAIVPTNPTMENFTRLFGNPDQPYLNWYVNTMVLATLVAVMTVPRLLVNVTSTPARPGSLPWVLWSPPRPFTSYQMVSPMLP